MTTGNELRREGAFQDSHGRWCHADHEDQWRGESEEEYLDRLRDLKEGLTF